MDVWPSPLSWSYPSLYDLKEPPRLPYSPKGREPPFPSQMAIENPLVSMSPPLPWSYPSPATLFSFPSRSIGNMWVLLKISFFAWEARWGKALTLHLVQKRGCILANRCLMCHENEEIIGRLLIYSWRWDINTNQEKFQYVIWDMGVRLDIRNGSS